MADIFWQNTGYRFEQWEATIAWLHLSVRRYGLSTLHYSKSSALFR